jgi:uncharacterized membrane protein YdbT with pleckstrin-like domain
MSFVESNLLPNEQVTYRAKLHWIIYLLPASYLLIALITFLVGVVSKGMLAGIFAGSFFGVIGLVALVQAWLSAITSEFAITNRRALIKVGLIRRHSLELLLEKVEGVGVDQNILGRIVGFGTITVSGVGGTKEPFRTIANPLEFRRQVQSRLSSLSTTK